MTPEQFRQVEALFHRGKDLPPDEQRALLDAECGDDPEVRAEVEKLLANADPQETLAALRGEVREALGPGADDRSAAVGGPAIEGYEIIREIHRGGQGVVYQAIQKSTKRKVAIKVLLEGPYASKSARRRFEREIELVAQLKHPNIVSIFHSGQTSDGRQYCVMDYVRGVPLDQYVRNEKLTLEDALRLFAKVCEAVNYAHQKGVIHRDLKPSNILVDSDGEPKVLDFGLAKQLISREASLISLTGQVVGTLPYMSPEQAEGNPDKIDIRTDVYALGVILYQMLTGHYPYPVAGKMAEVLKHIAETEPTPPTRSWKSGSGVTQRTHKRIRPGQCPIDDEVQTIVLRTLAKERERRYQSAGELAKDVAHYLADEPIDAKRDSAFYVIRKQLRRYKLPVAVAAAFVMVITLSLVVSVSLWRQAERDRLTAVAAEREQSRAREEAETARDDAEKQKQQARRQSYLASIRGAQAGIQANDVRSAGALLDQAPDELRRWEWKYLHAQLDQSLAVFRGHEGPVYSVAFSPDGSRIASGSGDRTVRLWDTSTGDALQVLRGHDGMLKGRHSVAFSPDGSRIATGSYDKTVRLWDAASGEQLRVFRGHEGWIDLVAFSPDGSRIASAGLRDSTVRLWDASSGEELRVLRVRKNSVCLVAFSPDGSRIAAVEADGTVRQWNASSGEELAVLRGHEHGVWSVAFSPDGSRIASAGLRDSTVRLWDASSGQELAVLRGHEGSVYSVAFSPDGSRIASGCSDKMVRIGDTVNGHELAVLRGHGDDVNSVAFSLDGKRIVSGSRDGTVRLWDASIPDDFASLRVDQGPISSVAFSPDGSRIATASIFGRHKFLLWDALTGEQLLVIRGHETSVHSVVFSPDGSRIATGSSDKTVRLWDAASGEQLLVIRGHEASVNSVAFSPDGSRIASGLGDKTVRVWDAANGDELLVLRGHEERVTSVAFSPDGSRIASASGTWGPGENGSARVWDSASGDELLVLGGHEGSVNSIAFSPDGSRIATGSYDKTVRLWGAASGEELLVLRGHQELVFALAFSADGSRITSGSYDNTVRLWDTSTGDMLLVLRGHQEVVESIAFSPDGSRIASSGYGTVRLWDTIAYRDRVAQRDDARRAEQTIRPFVDELFGKGLDCTAVADQVRADASLSDPLRHAAINLVIKRCSAILKQAYFLIDDVEKHLVFAADIQAAVKAAPSLKPAAHAAAINIAHLIEDSPDELFRRAVRVIYDDKRSPADYEEAQKAAASAFDYKPTNLNFAKSLVKAWIRLHQPDKAVEVWREHVEKLRDTPPDDRHWTSALIEYGKALVKNDRAKEAEPLLRECLSFQINKGWNEGRNESFKEARRLLAECLTKLARFTEAEVILIEMADDVMGVGMASKDDKTEAIQRVVDFYEAWHAAEPGADLDSTGGTPLPQKAAEWRAKLPAATSQPAPTSQPTTQPDGADAATVP